MAKKCKACGGTKRHHGGLTEWCPICHGTGVEPVAKCQHEESPCEECRSGPLVRPGVCFLGEPCAHAASGGPCKYEPTDIVALRSRLAAVVEAGEEMADVLGGCRDSDDCDCTWCKRIDSALAAWKKVRG